MKYFMLLLTLFCSITSLNSCNSVQHDSIQISDTDRVVIKRFDSDLYMVLKDSTLNIETLQEHYGDFLSAFGSVTINQPDYNKSQFLTALKNYFSHEILSRIYADALNKFRNIKLYEDELSEANARLKILLPGKKLPKLCIHVSGFKANTIVLDSLISISSDKYLGKEYPLYSQFFAPYLRAEMKPELITRDYLKAWIIGELPSDNKKDDLLTEMIAQGKILYSLQQLLPAWNNFNIIGYSEQQFQWAVQNEKQIWKSILQQNHLYSSDYQILSKYIDNAPYTATISEESPPRLGMWIGWQIISRYSEKTSLPLADILKETDVQKILKLSKYNSL